MPLPYWGGKGKAELGGWLFKNFDLTGINNYVEPFSGMFGIFLGNFSDFSGVKNIIYNDIDKQNCNIFNCFQVPLPFIDEIHQSFRHGGLFYTKRGTSYEEKYEYYKSIYMDYHKGRSVLPDINLSERDYHSALIYSFLRLTSIKQFHYKNIGFKEFTMVENWYKRYKFLQPLYNKLTNPEYINKIAKIKSITDDDFEKVMERYNTEDSFIYLDPPYYLREALYDPSKTGVFTVEDHQRLAQAVKRSKARIAVSYYFFNEVYELYPKVDFNYKHKIVRNSAGEKNDTEYIIMNYSK